MARAVTVPATGKNGGVPAVENLSVDEMTAALAAGSHLMLSPTVGVSQLAHALQTAALLARDHPDDVELAVAGLVHDIGHVLAGGTDETHADDAARAVRHALGERVAGIVALHVEAKRYLVATEGTYGDLLSGDSVVSLGRQGGAMGAAEVHAFRTLRWADDAVTLRRADDSGKVQGLAVRDLNDWVPILRRLSAPAGGAPA
jgi:predicted HD phosphohydrolase